MATTIKVPCFGTFKELIQNRFGYVQIQTDFSRNRFGIEWDFFLTHVVQIQQTAVSQILRIRQMHGVRQVVPDVEFVPNHLSSPKMSGRSVVRRTCPLVYRSIATDNSGLGTSRPEISRLNHVLLMPSLSAIASFAPRGLVSKNSVNVMYLLFGWFKRIIHQKNEYEAGLYFPLKFDRLGLQSKVKAKNAHRT
jgi:hypothetical protein